MSRPGAAQKGESPIIMQTRKRLEAWLRRGKRAGLTDWLKGYELPAVGHGEEPYVWLLRALSFSDDFCRREMAGRVALLLERERPHEPRGGRYDHRLIYNLLYLCAGLRRREELGAALYRVYDFFAERGGAAALGAAGGRYDLSGALRDALITNQTDQRFNDAWKRMLAGDPPEMLQGGRYAGLDGLTHMPSRERGVYAPDVEAVGWALARMAEYLSGELGRHKAFRRLVERVKKAWPEYTRWDEDLLRQAISNEWPAWAALRLDNLAVRIEKEHGREHALVWDFYLTYLRPCEPGLRPLSTPLGGLVADVWLNEEATRLLDFMRTCVEGARRKCPDANPDNVKLAASEALKVMTDDYWHKRREYWPEEEQKDSLVHRRLCEGRIKIVVDTRAPDKRQKAQKFLTAAAGRAGF
ncbi:MAG TPA: hypothetical protein VF508_11835 [Pyrinomonadaceae bacterium]|jgi:hypothetical protein